MSALTMSIKAPPQDRTREPGFAQLRLRRRALLIVACVAAAVIAKALSDPAAAGTFDPGLARLLQGMALLKGVFALATMGVVMWRFNHPASSGLSMSYILGTAVIGGATVSIWELSAIPAAAAAFHGALILLGVAAFRDSGSDLPTGGSGSVLARRHPPRAASRALASGEPS